MTQAVAVDNEARAAAEWLGGVVAAGARLTADSRAIGAGDVFVAWPGERRDGRDFIADAIARGAAAVLYEAEAADAGMPARDEAAAPSVPRRAVRNLRMQAGPIASRRLGDPTAGLTVIAVTGTNGKTSCTHWIAAGCNAGHPEPVAAVIGTLGAGLPGTLRDTGLTTPDALALQQTFADFVAAGFTIAAIEASSIGLAQGRLNGTRIAVAVLTNLSRDHLDYHDSMQAYADAKARLFSWPGLETVVVNLEDALSVTLLEQVADAPQRIGYVVDDSDIGPIAAARTELAWTRADRCTELLIAKPVDGLGRFVLTLARPPEDDDAPPQTSSVDVTLALLGRFNVSNALAVAGAWRALGWSLDVIAARLAELRPVPGRLEIVGDIEDGSQPLVVVDYAHSPDALVNALTALRPLAAARNGRLWCVFGAGGDRDAGKRPLMAAAVEAHADRLVVTSDNPRSESPDAIIAGLLAGLRQPPAALSADKAPRVEVDRARAIALAVEQAADADVVLVAGKGHEAWQEIAGVRQPFSDAEQARQALAARRGLADV